MSKYKEYDVVVLDEDEIMYYFEVPDNEKHRVVEKASKDEAEYYAKEYKYWQTEIADAECGGFGRIYG